MKKRNLTVLTVEIDGIEKAKEIALQCWNIKTRGTYVDADFRTDDTVTVKFFDDEDNNARQVVESWGEIVYEEKEVALMFSDSDFAAANDVFMEDAHHASFDDGFTGFVQFIEEK